MAHRRASGLRKHEELSIMPLRPITTKRLYLQIADQLAQAMRDGEYPAGTSLPPERALAERLRVSRASVREALVALQLMGMVNVRAGDGAVVTPASGEGAVLDGLSQAVSVFDLQSVRELVEPQVARLAAQNATEEDLGVLEDAL